MRFFTILLFTLFLTFGVFGQKQRLKVKTSSLKKDAPNFSAKDLNGKKIDLEKLKGKIVVLNFWYLGCVPCLTEIPRLNKLVEVYKDKDVVFIAFTEDTAKKLKPFLKKHPFEYRIIPDSLKLIGQYGVRIGNESLMLYPTHILIDQEGKIESRVAGLEGIKAMEKGIKKLLETENPK